MTLDTTVRARVNSELKADVERIFKSLGINTSQAINMFLNRVKAENGIPFELKVPNEETLRIIKEAKEDKNMKEISFDEFKSSLNA